MLLSFSSPLECQNVRSRCHSQGSASWPGCRWPCAAPATTNGGPEAFADAAERRATQLACWPCLLPWWGGWNDDAFFRPGQVRHVLVRSLRASASCNRYMMRFPRVDTRLAAPASLTKVSKGGRASQGSLSPLAAGTKPLPGRGLCLTRSERTEKKHPGWCPHGVLGVTGYWSEATRPLGRQHQSNKSYYLLKRRGKCAIRGKC
jgi:hypothetical protein